MKKPFIKSADGMVVFDICGGRLIFSDEKIVTNPQDLKKKGT